MLSMRSSSRLEQRPRSIGNKILIEAISLVYLSATFPLMRSRVYQGLKDRCKWGHRGFGNFSQVRLVQYTATRAIVAIRSMLDPQVEVLSYLGSPSSRE